MRSACTYLVESCGDWWLYIGWCLFICRIILPFAVTGTMTTVTVWIVIGALTMIWWAIDAADQLVPAWQVLTGIVMLTIGMIPMGLLLRVGCWAIYWTKVRE
jgi:hypothetical protein